MQAGNLRVLGPVSSPVTGTVASSTRVPAASTGPLLPTSPPARGTCASIALTSTQVTASTTISTAASLSVA